MLENWLECIDPKLNTHCLEGTIGNTIQINYNGIDKLDDVQIAIISDKHPSNNHWRKEWYSLFNHFSKLKIADLGSLRKNNNECLIPVLKDLLTGGIFPIVIAQDESLSESLFVAYNSFGQWLKLLIIDEKIRMSDEKDKKNYVNKLLQEKIRNFIIPSILGYQIHFTPPQNLEFIHYFFLEHIRLGQIIPNLEITEPIIRDADMMLFHLSSIKSSEAPGVHHPTPNGFTGIEACQLCRYAGFSDKLSLAGIVGLNPKNDPEHQTSHLIAQMIWYILDGFYHRLNEFPVSIKGLQAYLVDHKSNDVSLTFWKSKLSGRWWIQIPGVEFSEKDRHALIPCLHNDYVMATNGELSDKLFMLLHRLN